MSTETEKTNSMPGFNVPLNTLPKGNVLGSYVPGFTMALDSQVLEVCDLGNLTTYRELLMMRIMNAITEKPDWNRKVLDDEIVAKWRAEITESGKDVTPNMMDWIFDELRYKSRIHDVSGEVTVFDIGVVKSDVVVSKDIQEQLKEAVKPFEDIPEDQRDYHPDSDDQVVDLVHPSLFPVVYGRTRVLPEKMLGLDDCLHYVGQGEVLAIPPKKDRDHSLLQGIGYGNSTASNYPFYSKDFQWLPCEVELLKEGGCQIKSYINNAHPVHHKALYQVVEKIIDRTIPLWETSLSEPCEHRIHFDQVEYADHPEPEPVEPEDEEEWNDYHDLHEEWLARQPIILPEPGDFRGRRSPSALELRKHFPDTNMQIIVKLANIELTPEKPTYNGGSWHIEGQLNERICATAIYYYDNENITENTLDFRQRGMCNMNEEVSYEQGRHEFLQTVFGFGDEDVSSGRDDDVTQDLGGVICKEGRLLTFPNTVQHRVSSFSLADPSKPGHRKILALFLVDPHRRVISSANVPPQREDWGIERKVLVDKALSRLPVELKDMVEEDIDHLMTMEEAKELRLKLMKERGLRSEAFNGVFERGDFSLCEH